MASGLHMKNKNKNENILRQIYKKKVKIIKISIILIDYAY